MSCAGVSPKNGLFVFGPLIFFLSIPGHLSMNLELFFQNHVGGSRCDVFIEFDTMLTIITILSNKVGIDS